MWITSHDLRSLNILNLIPFSFSLRGLPRSRLKVFSRPLGSNLSDSQNSRNEVSYSLG